MGMDFTPQESVALYQLLAEHGPDIVLKTDPRGFIVHASPHAGPLGFAQGAELIGRHLVDLVDPAEAPAIEAAHAAVVGARQESAWAEFPARTRGCGSPWFEIMMRGLVDEHDQVYGAVCVLRSIEDRRALEDEAFTAAMTDPLTGLTNRRAFTLMLQHMVDKRIGGCLAIFSIDYFKAINMQHGQAFGDEVLIVFSGLLRSLMRSDDILSRIGGETIGVLLPATTPGQVEPICQRVIATLSEIRRSAGPGGVAITASVGVARIETSFDDTMKRAELALFMARAKGRDRLEMEDARALPGAQAQAQAQAQKTLLL